MICLALLLPYLAALAACSLTRPKLAIQSAQRGASWVSSSGTAVAHVRGTSGTYRTTHGTEPTLGLVPWRYGTSRDLSELAGRDCAGLYSAIEEKCAAIR